MNQILQLVSHCRRTVKDKQTGQNVILSEKDVELIDRIQSGHIPDSGFQQYAVIFIFEGR